MYAGGYSTVNEEMAVGNSQRASTTSKISQQKVIPSSSFTPQSTNSHSINLNTCQRKNPEDQVSLSDINKILRVLMKKVDYLVTEAESREFARSGMLSLPPAASNLEELDAIVNTDQLVN